MMKYALFILLFFLANFCTTLTKAQTGWKWGIGSTQGNGEAWPVAVDKNGNVFASGYGCTRIGADTLHGGFFVTKADSSGHFVWARGTASYAVHQGVATDTAGNIYALGVYQSSLTIDTFHLTISSGAQEYFLVKISAGGTVLWAKNMTGNNGTPTYFYGGLALDQAGNIYITGVYSSPTDTVGATVITNRSDPGLYDAFLAKFDTSGHPVWVKNMGGKKNDFAYTVAVGPMGNVYVAGGYGSDTLHIGGVNLTNPLWASYKMSYLAKFDSAGNLQWAKNISQHIGIGGIKTDRSENICVAGFVDSNFTILGSDTLHCTGAKDLFIGKYNDSGKVVWAASAGGMYTDNANNIDVDTCGNLWVCGPMGGSSLAPGMHYSMSFPGDTLNTPPGNVDPIFIAEYSNSGVYMRSSALGGGGDDQSGIAIDGRGSVYVCGDFEDSNLVIGPDTLKIPIAGTAPEYLFIGRYKYNETCLPAGIVPVKPASPDIVLYPNPATSECTIHCDIPFLPGAVAELYDFTGRHVSTVPLYGSDAVIPLSRLVPGLYQCRIVQGDNKVVVKKLVVMK